MTIERVAIKDVKPNPDNPRIIKDDKFTKLVQSIKDFPQMLDLRPIVVNADLMVLGGNMRLKACQAAGLTHVPIVRADTLTPEQEREFIIKDNVGFGEWDWDALGNEWDMDDLSRWGVDIPTFDGAEEELDASPALDGTKFQVVVTCKDDIQQANLADELEQKGYKCQLLTL